jgi:hypothetical protein
LPSNRHICEIGLLGLDALPAFVLSWLIGSLAGRVCHKIVGAGLEFPHIAVSTIETL